MSGFEIVGVVLAAIPLIVTTLDSYSQAWQTIDGLLHHNKALCSFHHDLNLECFVFQNTCAFLLGPSWVEDGTFLREEDIRIALESSFPDEDTLRCFLSSMGDMNGLIQELRTKFPPEDTSCEIGRTKLKQIKKAFKLSALESLHASMFARIKYINQRLDMLVKPGSTFDPKVARNYPTGKTLGVYHAVRRHATILYEVMKDNMERTGTACNCPSPHEAALQLDPRDISSRRPSSAPIRFRTFLSMKSANSEILWKGADIEPAKESDEEQSKDMTPGVAPHTTLLATSGNFLSVPIVPDRPRSPIRETGRVFKNALRRVGFRSVPEELTVPVGRISVAYRVSSPTSEFRHSVVGRGVQTSINIDITGDTDCRSSSIPVLDMLCKVWHLINVSADNSISYVFLDSCTTPVRRHRIFPIMGDSESISNSPLVTGQRKASLYEIYRRQISITLKQKLNIAVCLASSVLQLYTSGWMDENWTGDDIVFLEESPGKISLDYPLTSGRLRKVNSSTVSPGYVKPPPLPLFCHTTRSMLSLGIALIELQHQKSLSDIPTGGVLAATASQTNSFNLYENDRLMKAYILCEELKNDDNEVEYYKNVVHKCIHGFNTEGRGTMEDKEYRKDVYLEIICPLRNALSIAFPDD